MPVSNNILRTWRDPRRVMRGLLAAGQREDRAIAYLMVGCLLVFVAQWPRLMREAHFDTATPFDLKLHESLYALLIIAPLLFYAIAALSHIVARLLGGRGSWYGARLALFWTLLATGPLMLFYGVLAGLNGQTPATKVVGLLWLAAFAVIWLQSLREAEGGASDV